jgi:peptidoglycan/LPS O-acetylase OafA/YrhL
MRILIALRAALASLRLKGRSGHANKGSDLPGRKIEPTWSQRSETVTSSAMAERGSLAGGVGEVPVLNGIRGLLALWVLLGHTLICCGGDLPFLGTPGMAAYGFMVMSGFLMALHFRLREQQEPWNQPRTWIIFYVRRFFRIAPVYYFALAIAVPLHAKLMTEYSQITQHFRSIGSGAPVDQSFGLTSLGLHATFVFGAIPSQANSNILPDWSLGLEMQFYLVFPLLMLALRKIGAVWFSSAALAVVFASHPLTAQFPLPSFLPLVLTTFVIGMLMSEARLSQDKMQAAALLVIAMFLASVRMPARFQAIALAMILMINFPGLFQQLKIMRLGNIVIGMLDGRFGKFIGDRSYSVYLLHMLVVVPLLSVLAGEAWFNNSSALIRFAMVTPVVVIVTYSLASVTLAFVETPFISIGRSIIAYSTLQRTRPKDERQMAIVAVSVRDPAAPLSDWLLKSLCRGENS